MLRARRALHVFAVLTTGCSLFLDPDTGDLGGATLSGGKPDGGLDGAPSRVDSSTDPGDGGDGAPSCKACDDEIACTEDRCVSDGTCEHVPGDQFCKKNQRCSPLKGCVPERCRDDSDCSDASVCTGEELCDPGAAGSDPRSGCVPGTALSCDDKVPCTVDSCAPATGCAHRPDDARCDDDVACTIDSCDEKLDCKHAPDDTGCEFCRVGSVCHVEDGCVGGILDRICDDAKACTEDTCDPASKKCVHTDTCGVPPDDCAHAEDIDLDSNGRATVIGSFANLTPTYGSSCGQGGRDAVYRLQIESVSDIVLDTTGGGTNTIVALGRVCQPAAFTFGCAGSVSSQIGGTRLVVHRYDPAVHGNELFVLLDAQSNGTTSGYELDVSVRPVAADQCGDVLALSGCGTVVGFMDDRGPANAWGEQRGTCQSGPGEEAPEAIVLIPGAADGNVSLVVTSDDFQPALYVRTECASTDNDVELGCDDASENGASPGRAAFTAQLGDSASGFVFIDGGIDGGKYTFRCVP